MSRTLRSILVVALVAAGLAVAVAPIPAEADPPDPWTVTSPATPALPPDAQADAAFLDVSCTGVDFCIAVGDAAIGYADDHPLVEVWDGSTWTELSFDGPKVDGHRGFDYDYAIESVGCWSATGCLLFMQEFWIEEDGEGGLQEYDTWGYLVVWDGSSFVIQPQRCCGNPENTLEIDCAPDETCIAKDTADGGFSIWHSGTWVAGDVASAELGPAACGSDTFCSIPGDGDGSERWTGTALQQDPPVPSPSGMSFEANSVDCLSDIRCLAVGSYRWPGPFTPAYARWDGTGWWSFGFSPVQGAPRELSCGSAAHCVGISSAYSPGPWPFPVGSALNVIHLWNGLSWSRGQDAPGDDDTGYMDISCVDSMCMAVGWDGPAGSRALVASRLDVGDGPPVASVGDVVVTETLQRGWWVPASFPITLSEPAAEDVVVELETRDGTALAGADFVGATGQVTISAGQRHGTITVWVKGDGFYEGSGGYATPGAENFTVELTGVSGGGAVVGRSLGAGLIRDSVPGAVVGDVTIIEGDGGSVRGWMTVSLEQPAGGPVELEYTTFNHGAAVAGVDYLTRSGTVTIPAGKAQTRIPVWVRGDISAEATETFGIVLTGASGADITDGLGVVTIATDE